MAVFIALLRAVNVGGTGKLPMAQLRSICAKAGFTDIRTYIQSGNVIFATGQTMKAAQAALEARLHACLGKPVGVILRDAAALRAALAGNPFPDAEPNRVAVLFIDGAPPADTCATAKGQKDEQIILGEGEIYIHYPSGMGQSRLRLAAMEQGTARNLNTVAKLVGMVDETGV